MSALRQLFVLLSTQRPKDSSGSSVYLCIHEMLCNCSNVRISPGLPDIRESPRNPQVVTNGDAMGSVRTRRRRRRRRNWVGGEWICSQIWRWTGLAILRHIDFRYTTRRKLEIVNRCWAAATTSEVRPGRDVCSRTQSRISNGEDWWRGGTNINDKLG